MLYVESGTFGWTLLEGQATLTRGTTEDAAIEEITDLNTEILLEAGDWMFYGDDVIHTARNAGDDPVVLFVSALFAAEQPGIIFMDDMEHADE